MALGAVIGSVAGSVAGPVLSYIGQKETNRSNETMAKDQMRFQSDMSNTAHQRQVADLKKAGLNPLLSATGGASTPSGAMAVHENALGKGVATAMEGTRLVQDVKKQSAEIKNLDATNDLTKAQTAKTKTEERVLRKGIPQSDLLNEGADILRPALRKIRDALTPSAKTQQQRNNEAIQQFHNLTNPRRP